MQKPTEWLVTPPEGVTFGDALTAACGGNNKLQKLLNVFLFQAHLEAKNRKLDPKLVETITIYRTQDRIIECLEKNQSLKTSKRSLIAWVSKLQDFNYLQVDARRQAYHINIKAIKDGIATPPEPEVLPRGRHASPSQKVKSSNCTFENEGQKVKSSNQAQIEVSEMWREFELLSQKFNSLQLQFEDLQIEVLSERASRAELEAQIASLYSNVLDITRKESNVSSPLATSSTNEEKPANVISLQEKQAEKSSVAEEPPTSPDPQQVKLTQEERAVYDLVFHGRARKQKITSELQGNLAAMVPHVKTLEDLEALEPYARDSIKNEKARNDVLFVGNYFNGLDAWLQAKKIAEQPKPATTGAKNNKNGTLTGHANGADYIKAMEEKYMNNPRPKRTLNLDFKAKAN